MQYGKTGSSGQKFITDKPVPQKFQIFVSNSRKLLLTFLVFKGRTNSDCKSVQKVHFQSAVAQKFQQGSTSLKRSYLRD
jgi:hypothetical protein